MEPARHTSALLISGFLFDNHEGITTLSPGGLFGGRVAAPPEGTALGTAAPRSSTPSTTPSGCWTTTRRGYHCCRSGCQDMLRRHVVAPGVLSLCMHFSTSFLVNTSGRALGCCCGGVLRGQRWDIVAAGPSGVHKLSRHTPRSRPLFLEFSPSVDLPVVLSLLYCLPSNEDFVFFRSASRWSIGDEQGHRFLRFPAPHLLFNGAQYHSPEVRGFPRLLHCEQLVQQSRCFFSQWRAHCLFLSLRRRNHLVSDVDRRETGLFPGKSDVAVWIITLKKSFFQPFHPQSESAIRKVHEDARSAQLAAALGTSPAGPHPDPSSTG